MSFPNTMFYVPGAMNIIDYAIMRDGVLRGGYSNETLDEIRKRYPGAIVGELDKFVDERDASLRTEPVEITAEQWTEALEVLPPLDHVYDGTACTFKCMEMLCGRITAVYCRIGKRCFTFNDYCSISHADILTKVMRKLAEVKTV